MNEKPEENQIVLSEHKPKGVLLLPGSKCKVLLEHAGLSPDEGPSVEHSIPSETRISVDREIGGTTVQTWQMPAQAQLRERLDSYFSAEEIRDLCFDLDIDYDRLPTVKARELLRRLKRKGKRCDLNRILERRHSEFYQTISDEERQWLKEDCEQTRSIHQDRRRDF